MKDTKITKAVINERKELSLSILVKEWDYTSEELELLRQAKIEWNTLDFEIVWLKKSNWEEEMKEWRQKLALVMSDYCRKYWYKEEEEIERLYKKKKIKSRVELSIAELQEEYEKYKEWIIHNIP